MRVLVTGAFGNIGSHVLPELIERGHRVRCLSVGGRGDRRLAARFGSQIEVLSGDVREPEDCRRAVVDQDAIIHLAYIIPPAALARPEAARRVNVDGTRNLLDAAIALPVKPRFLFASTLDVFGHTQRLAPPRRVGDPVSATDVYSEHKIACEELVRSSGLVHAIVRFADVPPIALRSPHPIMFKIPLATRIEMIHPDDAGLALARVLDVEEAWGRVLLVGGGAGCQLVYRDYLGAFLESMGIGALPEAAFGHDEYCTDWLDTDESQALLGYQRKKFEDVVREVSALMTWQRPLVRALRPLIRGSILQMSSFWRNRSKHLQRPSPTP